MSSTLSRPLPGLRFDVPAPALDEALPRMDIACFVGFAQRGPVGVPVAVESTLEFESVFGAELVLVAATSETEEDTRALMPGSVAQFFLQGGRRAWVVRVAGDDAVTTRFPVQRMLQARRAPGSGDWVAKTAWLRAGSPGAWADGLRLQAWVSSHALALTPLALSGEQLALRAEGPHALGLMPGEAIRVQLDVDDWVQGRVAETGVVHMNAARLQRDITLDRLCTVKAVIGEPSLMRMVWMERGARGRDEIERPVAAEGQWSAGRLRWRCRLPARVALGVGEVVQLHFRRGAQAAWAALDEVHLTGVPDEQGLVTAELSARPWRVPARLGRATLLRWVNSAQPRTGHWLQANLEASGQPGTLNNAKASSSGALALNLAPGIAPSSDHPELDDDTTWQSRQRALPGLVDDWLHHQHQAMQPRSLQDAANRSLRRFPLSADDGAIDCFWLPLGDLSNWNAPDAGEGLGARGVGLPALMREGLADYSWHLFADRQLASLPTEALTEQADNLLALHTRAQPLRGLHAAFGYGQTGLGEEATLLLAPDAVHPGWQRVTGQGAARSIHRTPNTPLETDRSQFLSCSLRPLAAPAFLPDAAPDAQGHFRIRWSEPEAGLCYELQESTTADFAIAVTLQKGRLTLFNAIGKARGTWHYRVRAHDGQRVSPWSHRLQVRIGHSDFELRAFQDTDLLAVHRLMLRIAAARGDLLAVQALPQQAQWTDARLHADRLRTPDPTAEVPGLLPDEARALSHGCLQHPWLQLRSGERVISAPPDGATAGQLAASAWQRGAWLAVANRPLKDVLGVSLAASIAERQALLEAQVNPVVTAAHGVVLAGEDTLYHLDADWRPVHVRRLMSLLRRAALRRGNQYVFEPNGPTLHRTIERAFESLLGELMQRGAFAGRSAREAFQVVVVDDGLNSPASIDAGRLFIELKVAPAQALRFLTVRLVRAGDRVRAQENMA
ncbi:MAG: hypothetical protein KKD97_14050 [Gammaproteobacteria bacterium]|nr:hypothetical protein [Gammaproteobacteria bacterium]